MSADSLTAPAAPPRELGEPPAPRRPARRLPRPRLTPLTIAVSLLVLLGLSVWLRTRAIHMFLWIDEGLSVGIASHPLAHIPGLMRQDGSPPLYYLVLHVWMSMRGHSEVSTHELSLIFALLTIPVAYWAGASLFDRRTGLVCALLAAAVPYLTFYAQETRMYSLMTLLSLIVAASFVHVYVRRRRGYLPVFSVSLAAAMYTHNWALFLALMAAVAFAWCLVRCPSARRELWRDGLIGFGVVAVLFAAWIPTVLYQARHTGAPWDLPPVIWSITQGLYFMVGGRGVAMLFLFGAGVGLLALRGTARPSAPSSVPSSAPAALSAAGARARLARLGDGVPWPQLGAECLLILGLGTMLLAWLYSKHSPAWAPRYLAAVVGPLLLAAGLGFARGGRVAIVALALTACFWVLDPRPTNKHSKSNVAAVAADVRSQIGPHDLVLSTQPEQVPTIAYYLPAARHFATPLGPVADPRVVDWRDALSKFNHSSVHAVLGPMVDRLHPGQKILLVVPMRFASAPLWMKLIHRMSVRYSYFLWHNPRLRYIGGSNAKYYDAGVPVQAGIWEVRR